MTAADDKSHPESPVAIECISAVTLTVHEMPRSVRFYQSLGFTVLHGGEVSSFTSLQAGSSYLNLAVSDDVQQPARWGRVIFHVSDVDTVYQRAVDAGYRPQAPPRDASRGERYFRLADPDQHELSFAKPLAKTA